MTSQREDGADEGVLDPWVADWLAANPERATAFDFVAAPEILELARGPVGFPPTREIAGITDEVVEGVPVRIYQDAGAPTGLVVYFHGGGYVMGSIGLMDNVARELAHGSGAVVVSVEYRLAPEHPYPAGLDDCERVTRWAFANAARFGVSPTSVAVSGESAGGNLAAAVVLRLQDAHDVSLAGQVLIYPQVSGTATYPSAVEFDGLVINRDVGAKYWAAYSGGRDLDDDPFAVPLSATNLRGLPPALVVLAGCDMLRDEGRAYADRLRDADVDVDEVCYPGQPHGFVNFEFPAAAPAFERIGTWLRARLPSSSGATMTSDRVAVTRRIAASADELFAIVSSPTGHVDIDGSGMLVAAPDARPLTAVGETFDMDMDREPLGDYPELGKYQVRNTVTQFVPGRLFEWTVGSADRPPIGHLYGWQLEPVNDHETDVTNYCDWTAIPDDVKTRVQWPIVPVRMLEQSVEKLARLATTS